MDFPGKPTFLDQKHWPSIGPAQDSDHTLGLLTLPGRAARPRNDVHPREGHIWKYT